MKTAARLIAAAVFALTTTAGCSFARRDTVRDQPEGETFRVGDGDGDIAATTTTTTTSTDDGAGAASTAGPDAAAESDPDTGEFDLVVTGRADGRPRPGITATVTGPQSFQVTSGEGGRLRYRGQPGHYEVRIEPTCGDVIEVQTSAIGRVAVAAGDTATGTLSVAWRHRFAPGPPVSYQDAENPEATGSRGRRWPVGTSYLARFAVLDRCSDRPAPGARFPTFRFSSQPEVTVEPQVDATADGDGMAFVRLTCKAPVSEIQLLSTDAEAPDDRLDLFDRAVLDDSAPDCVA